MTTKTYTRDEVNKAINAGADLVLDNLSDDFNEAEAYANAANVIVCMIAAVLENPAVTFADAMAEAFQGSLTQWSSEFGFTDEEDE